MPDDRTKVNRTNQSRVVASEVDPSSIRLMAKHARTFNFAARFLPAEKRRAAIALYAFFRSLDDLVDQPVAVLNTQQVQREFDAWRHWLTEGRSAPGPREPLAREVSAVIDRYEIPVVHFLDLLDGLESDLGAIDFEDDVDLRAYCYRVASTVGLAMSHVLGARSAAALSAAADLGMAMQLTNILRDVGEDLSLGRIYLPKSSLVCYKLSRQSLSELWLAGHGPDDRLRALMAEEIARARGLYTRGIAGIWLLPADSRLPILIASRLYRRILSVIEVNRYDTLRFRASTTTFEKLEEAAVSTLLIRLWRHGECSSDLEFNGFHRNFEAVDAVAQQ